MTSYQGNDRKLFEAVADTLIKHQADDDTLRHVLAATMDRVGVPMMSIERYREVPAIVALFGERGVRFATAEELEAAKQAREADHG